MKHKTPLIIFLLLFSFLFASCNNNQTTDNTSVTVRLGIDNIDKHLDIFENKNVGLITNPTGINSSYEATIDVLYKKTSLVSLFAPEHGIRGDLKEGVSTSNAYDVKTSLPIYSLYGNTKKPTKEMLEDIDILCIDIQDCGARFYTYIYTMAYAMMACKENNKKFVVFDRPNPVGGIVLDGNLLEEEFSSFVGMYPIITRHGMTIGELAQTFNNEFNINCDLKVIEMEGWKREMYQEDTNTIWIQPSPNMPTPDTALVYTATCIFEGVNISEGRGTTKPFEYIGAPFIDPFLWSDKLNSLKLDGVYFRPIYFTPNFDDYQGEQCGGVQVCVTDKTKFASVKAGYAMLYTIKELYPTKVVFSSYLKTLTGCNYVYNMTYSLSDLFEKIDRDVNEFKVVRDKYLIY